MAVRLFQPLTLHGMPLAHRIVVAPMTQFSAHDGAAGDWHLMHLGQFAVSGAALVVTESTYVEADARNAPSCLSIYSGEQAESIIRCGQADMVALARAILFNPRWPWQAAEELGAEIVYPKQYERAHPSRRMQSGVSSPGNQTAKLS